MFAIDLELARRRFHRFRCSTEFTNAGRLSESRNIRVEISNRFPERAGVRTPRGIYSQTHSLISKRGRLKQSASPKVSVDLNSIRGRIEPEV